MKTKKITIYDIAKDLQVAPSTVSKAINNTGSVSNDTKSKILEYVKSIGYVIDTNARNLKAKRSWTIGVVFSEEQNIGIEHPFFSSVFQHFKAYVERYGYELSFIVQQLGKNRLSYLEWCHNKKVDGVIIVVGDINDKGIIELVESEIKCVSTDLVSDYIHNVRSDNYQGVELAIDYLLSAGINNIATIPGPQTSQSFTERLLAFREIMKAKNLQLSEDAIVISEGFGFTSGYNAARKLIENAKEIPEAIICGSDDIAFGVIRGIEASGYQVPNDISVIGFDDIATSRLFTPALTTISQNKQAIGEMAGRILIDLINDGREYDKQTKIPVNLVIRDSVKKK